MRQQRLKNNFIKSFIILFSCILIQQVTFAVGENTMPVSTSYSDALQSAQNQVATQQTQTQTTQNQSATETLVHQAVNGTLENANQAIQEANQEEIKPITKEIQKQTRPKRSYINVIFKFVLAMLWVCISSVIIFIILLSYKRLILKGKPITPTYESTEQSLDTPKNFKEAIKLFLDKTKWN